MEEAETNMEPAGNTCSRILIIMADIVRQSDSSEVSNGENRAHISGHYQLGGNLHPCLHGGSLNRLICVDFEKHGLANVQYILKIVVHVRILKQIPQLPPSAAPCRRIGIAGGSDVS